MLKYVLEVTLKVLSSMEMNKKLVKGEYLDEILRSSKTVFSTKDVVLMWGEGRREVVTHRLNTYVKAGKLRRVRRGFYVKDEHYDWLELATRLYTPSYVSFETVLTREGVNFQYYANIFVASYLNREVMVDGQRITYVRIKTYALSNPLGILQKDHVAIASKERAFLDRLFVTKEYHFDYLGALNWQRIFELLPIYQSRRLEKQVRAYHADFIQHSSSV